MEILNILENFDVKGMGHNSKEHLHVLTEAMKMAYKDRGFFAADTDFIEVPLTGMASKEYAKELASQIDLEKAQVFEHGDAWAYESPQTTHYSIMDKQGNIVAVTKTVNYVFGSGIVPEGYGFIMNDEMDDFDAEVGTAGQETDEFHVPDHHSERRQTGYDNRRPRLSENYLRSCPGYLQCD